LRRSPERGGDGVGGLVAPFVILVIPLSRHAGACRHPRGSRSVPLPLVGPGMRRDDGRGRRGRTRTPRDPTHDQRDDGGSVACGTGPAPEGHPLPLRASRGENPAATHAILSHRTRTDPAPRPACFHRERRGGTEDDGGRPRGLSCLT
jgi:hypothetical protein